MRWDRNGEEKKGERGRCRGETMGLVQGWKGKREGRAIREGRGNRNEFLIHPE